jgi:hypothetical protein
MENQMRRILLGFLSIIAIAGPTEQPGPKLPPVRVLNLNLKPISKSKAPDRLLFNTTLTFDERMESRNHPRFDLPSIPYPNQVPSRHKGIFYGN